MFKGQSLPLAMFLVVMLVTWLTRALPFLVFGKKGISPTLRYINIVLPASIMMLLVLYSLRNVEYLSYPYGMPELISVAVTVALQRLKKNTFLSILVGTLCYMILIRTLFLV